MSANFHPLVYIIDYILGIIMWTLVGRVAMNIFQRENSEFFFMSPLLLLKIVVPETRIFAPASIAIFEFSKLIPPSISMSNSIF